MITLIARFVSTLRQFMKNATRLRQSAPQQKICPSDQKSDFPLRIDRMNTVASSCWLFDKTSTPDGVKSCTSIIPIIIELVYSQVLAFLRNTFGFNYYKIDIKPIQCSQYFSITALTIFMFPIIYISLISIIRHGHMPTWKLTVIINFLAGFAYTTCEPFQTSFNSLIMLYLIYFKFSDKISAKWNSSFYRQ